MVLIKVVENKISYKKLKDVHVYLLKEWSWGPPKIAMFEIL